MEKVWEIKDPDSYLKKTKVRKRSPADEKNPAKAYSLSLLYWGGGQLYNDQIASGAVLLITMVLLIVFAVLGATNFDELLKFLRESDISFSDAFLYLEASLFFIILVWIANAGGAYHHARRSRRTPFRGVNSRVTPLLCSLVLPGWGQFLNGQQLKGSIYASFSIASIFSLLSACLTYLAWPLLDASASRFLVESIFAVCVVIVPLVPFLWLFSAYDAFAVSRDDLKKEPLWERLKAAYYRGRTQGFVRGVVPQIKGTFLLALMLIFFLIVVTFWSPKEFYIERLTDIKKLLDERGMTIVPELIGRMLAWMTAH